MNRYKIDQIKLGLDEPKELLKAKIEKKLGKKASKANIGNIEILKRSIDARGERVSYVYSLAFDAKTSLNLKEYRKPEYVIPKLEPREGFSRPLVVGFGPCGIFAALVLARAGLRPIVIERGSRVETRVEKVQRFWRQGELDTECNVQFGEGGAGTFSDGKLNTGIKDKRIRFVLETFVRAGADEDILIDGRPHIGTDSLRGILKNLREEIISLGGEIRFDTKLESLVIEDRRVVGAKISCKEVNGAEPAEDTILTDNVVLAIGHSARDTVRTLYDQDILMEAKSFSMGVRIQHPQSLIDEALYGEEAGHPELPPAYYKLATKVSDGRGVYSFCMCPGGEIVNAASQEGGVVTNGMSNHHRDSGYANSGILVDVKPEDYQIASRHPLAGIEYQEKYERLAFVNGGGTYNIPETTWGEFRDETETAHPVIESLPPYVAEDIREAIPLFGKKIKGFDGEDSVIKAVESRSSSPVRMLRHRENLFGMLYQGSDGTAPVQLKGLYPGGEGAGYAGGITSAACDGIKIAEEIIKSFLPSE